MAAGESYILDNEHLIAWDNKIEYSTRLVGGLKSTLLSGEGVVFEFTGPGTAWYQTRDMDSLVEILASRMPSQGSIGRE
ncbi:AIM24 family protein [Halorubrum sp. BOL3-1]|uniref:AIM24 family protein n=1 Tax=Halorubrum sp. BOL3-1 TaxID=2497325 RepID=UPI003744A5B2